MAIFKFSPKKKSISTQEAAEMLGVNERTIRKYLENYKLEGRKVKGIWQVKLISVWKLMASENKI